MNQEWWLLIDETVNNSKYHTDRTEQSNDNEIYSNTSDLLWIITVGRYNDADQYVLRTDQSKWVVSSQNRWVVVITVGKYNDVDHTLEPNRVKWVVSFRLENITTLITL